MNPDGQRPSSKKKWLKESNIMELKVNIYDEEGGHDYSFGLNMNALIHIEKDKLQYSLL